MGNSEVRTFDDIDRAVREKTGIIAAEYLLWVSQ